MSKGSKQRPTDKSKYDSTYDKIFKDPEREAFDAINKRNNHDLKILTKYFEDVWNGSKTFELRKDDRDYKVGDTIRFCEYVPSELIKYTPFVSEYTGRECNRTITYVLRDCEKYGLQEGFVILGIK